MPPHRNLERLIGKAIVDEGFRASLLKSPLSAAEGFDLSTEELDLLRGSRAANLEDLAAQIHAWIARAPAPRRAVSPRWGMGEYQPIRMAV